MEEKDMDFIIKEAFEVFPDDIDKCVERSNELINDFKEKLDNKNLISHDVDIIKKIVIMRRINHPQSIYDEDKSLENYNSLEETDESNTLDELD